MASYSRTTVGLETNRAKLMYYLKTMSSVLDLSREASLQTLIDYNSYHALSDDELNILLAYCLLLNPLALEDKCIFNNDALCGNSSNMFYEISDVNQLLAVTENIIIGGKVRAVKTIMTYKPIWMTENYYNPMTYFSNRLAGSRTGTKTTNSIRP